MCELAKGSGGETSPVHYVRSSAREPLITIFYASPHVEQGPRARTRSRRRRQRWCGVAGGRVGRESAARLGLAELAEHRVDGVERCVDLLPDLLVGEGSVSITHRNILEDTSGLGRTDNYLSTREDDLARHEDEQDDLGLDHPVDETGEELTGHR